MLCTKNKKERKRDKVEERKTKRWRERKKM